MHLDKISPVVMDNIMEYLDNRDLAVLCRTSKAMNACAIKSLYSRPWPFKARNKIETCLTLNPHNTIYLREYHCTNIQQLSRIISKYPLQLNLLKLNYNARQISSKTKCQFHEACVELISHIHPQTRIREIDFSETNPALLCINDCYGINSGRFIEKLYAFQGLESLILKCWEFGDQTRSETFTCIQDVFDTINCPQLQCITFVDADIVVREWEVVLRDKLPNLKGVRFHYTHPTSTVEITEAEFAYLREYKRRKVYFQVTAYIYSKRYLSLFEAALRNRNEEEVGSFIEWLVYGEKYFQIEMDKRNNFILDLRCLKQKERDKILKFIQKLSFEPNFGLQLSLYVKDSDSFYFPKQIKQSHLLQNLLPLSNLTSLELHVQQSIHTKFVPTIIRSLPLLSTIIIGLNARKPDLEPSFYDTSITDHDGCCELPLEPGPWFTRAIYNVAITCQYLESSVCFNLVLKREQSPKWRIYDYDDKVQVEWADEPILGEMGEKNSEIMKELSRWFKVNSGLKVIDFRVFSGEPWDLK